MADRKQRLVLVAALVCPWILAPQAQACEELLQLLQDKRCPQCRLADVVLVHADLRDADLSGAELQRARSQRVAANVHPDSNNTPSSCCSPPSTQA